MKKNEFKSRQINGTKELLSDSSTSTNVSTTKQQKQKEAMQKLGTIFKKKTEQRRQPDTWQSLIQNLLHSQRGKLPLLLAVEAGNQSMVRELLSSQTQEQLKVSVQLYMHISGHLLTDSQGCLWRKLQKEWKLSCKTINSLSFTQCPLAFILSV